MTSKYSAGLLSRHRPLSVVARLLPLRNLSSWAFLAGSGISVRSGLPTAWTFNQRIAAFLGGSAVERRQIAALLRSGPADSMKALRFEQVIQILREIGGDKNLVVLDIFDDPGPPTELHFFLARVLRRGATVMTTNFDSLIERAFLSTVPPRSKGRLRAPGRLIQIHTETPSRWVSSQSTFRWYVAQRNLRPAVLKLHGTLRDLTSVGSGFASLAPTTARVSIGATLDAIGRAQASPGLEPGKDQVLRRAVRGRTICVVGYSGSDDFDVLPSLARAANMVAGIVWIRHGRGRTRVQLAATGIPTTRLPGVLKTASWGGRTIVIEGSTLGIIRSLFGAAATAPPATVLRPSTPLVRFETLPPYVTMTSARKLTIRGQLEETAGVLRAAERTYTRATLAAKRERDARSKAFALARLGHLARLRGSLRKAATFVRRAQTALTHSPGDDRLTATVFLAAGNIALDQTIWPVATRFYRRAITHAKLASWPRMEATVLNNLGLVYRRQGRFLDATRYILQALRVDRRLRDRTGMARDIGNLGIIAHERGNYRAALRYGRQALTLDRDMGNYTTLTTKRVDVALALIRLGRYGEAIKEIGSALRLARKYERPEDEARCWSARGLMHRERGNLTRGVQCHKQALTILRRIRRRESLAQELVELGEVYLSHGNRAATRQCLKQALTLFRALRNAHMVATVNHKLRTV